MGIGNIGSLLTCVLPAGTAEQDCRMTEWTVDDVPLPTEDRGGWSGGV